MKKSFTILLIAGLIFGVSFLPAQAVDIVVHDNGTVSFYSSSSVLKESLGQVLGDDDQADDSHEVEGEQENETEDENEAEQQNAERERELQKKAEEIKREAAKKQLEAAREAEKKQKELAREKAKTVRSLLNNKKTDIRIKTSGNKVNVSLESKAASRSGTSESKKKEEVETEDSVQMEIPRLLKLPENEIKNEEHAPAENALRERTQKTEDHLDLNSEVDENGELKLKLTSGQTTARIKNAEVVVDPTTNNVSVSSTTGETRRLNHLPDQAIKRIQELIQIQQTENGEEPKLDIETKNDGSVVYTTQSKKKKKLLGLFDREVETKIELNDDTGELSETQLPSTSAWQRFLDRFTL